MPKDAKYTVTEADYSKDYTTKAVQNGEKAAEGRTVSGTIVVNATQTVAFTNTAIEKHVLKGPEKSKDSKAKTTNKAKAGKAVKNGDDSFSVIWAGFLGSVLLLSVLVILSNIVKKRRR